MLFYEPLKSDSEVDGLGRPYSAFPKNERIRRRRGAERQDARYDQPVGHDQRRLCQFESRVRALGFENQVARSFGNNVDLEIYVGDMQNTCDENVKGVGGGRRMGSPHLHLCMLAGQHQ